MRVVMVMLAGRMCLVRLIGADARFNVDRMVIVLVTMVPEMCGVARTVLQGITNTHRSRIGGVQREHDGKNKSESGAHGIGVYHQGFLKIQ